MITLVPIVLVTYIIITLILYYVSFVETRRIVEKQVLLNISQKTQLSDNYLTKIFVETEVFMFDKEVQAKIRTKKSALPLEEQSKHSTEMLNNLMRTIISYDDNVQGICIRNIHGDIYLWKMDSRSPYNAFAGRIDDLEASAQAYEGRPYLTYDQMDKNLVTVTRIIMDPITREKIGVIVLDCAMDFLQDINSATAGAPEGDILIFTPDNSLILNSGAVENDVANLVSQGKNKFRYQGKTYSVVRKTSSYGNWEIVGLINETVLYHNIYQATVRQIAFMGLSLLLILSAIYYISWTVSGQFKGFMKAIQNSPDNEGNSTDIHVETKDEFLPLSRVYNQMLARNRLLIDTIYTKEIHLKDAEIKALHAQINPHFLYNTLDCINSLISCGDKESSQKAVSCLVDIMRMSIKGADIIPIRDDLHCLNEYLFIQKCRFGSRILFLIDIPESILDYMIPKLVLQPLVENAINHGLHNKLEGGMLGVWGQEESDAVVLFVKDNGTGIQQEIIDRVASAPQKNHNIYFSEKGGIGVMNIQSRIQLLYGPEYGIQIRNIESGGTSVCIRLPKITQEDIHENTDC